jgi:acetyl-CoA synthetase
MSESKVYDLLDTWTKDTLCTNDQYKKLYRESIENPNAFWNIQAARLSWQKKWDKVSDWSFSGDVHVRWFEGGELNVSENCVDRHAEKTPHKVAIIWESDDVNEKSLKITYQELKNHVCKFANILKSNGVKKGDRVTLYMPMIPEAAYAMLACSRIGAVHSVIFGGFSPDAVADRILDCESDFIITADEGLRGGKKIPLKANIDKALKRCPDVRRVLVVKRTGGAIEMKDHRDIWYHDALLKVNADCEATPMKSEDPLFILYTSGSTGKPKGVLHTTAGYLLFASLTHQYVFDYKEGEIYWCTADVGWVTGHSYIVYGPLANGATTLMFEGIPNYPSFSRHWEIIDKHQVNIYYTAPTAIRALMREGDDPVKKTSRKSLRLLGSVGEPINPEAWEWYFHKVGEERCSVVDTWWQTETGGILITPLPGATKLKPGSATRPFFGIEPVLVDESGAELNGAATGQLCLKTSWPGMMRTVYKNHARFVETYFSKFKGMYFTGDGCRRDEDGYYWITGRIDDVINVSGHRLGTAEVESALVAHHSVSESAVVGFPHDIKGQGIWAFVTLKEGTKATEELRKELVQWVRKEIGPIATPDAIQWAPALPKTRSGKIMRRILRKVAANDFTDLGDTSTLADPTCVESLIRERGNH